MYFKNASHFFTFAIQPMYLTVYIIIIICVWSTVPQAVKLIYCLSYFVFSN